MENICEINFPPVFSVGTPSKFYRYSVKLRGINFQTISETEKLKNEFAISVFGELGDHWVYADFETLEFV